MRKLLLILIVLGTLYNLPKLINPATPPDDVVKDDFCSLVVSNLSGSVGIVKRPNGWVGGAFNVPGLSGEYRARIAEFKITRQKPEISNGTFGIRGEKIYRVVIFKRIERQYDAPGDNERLNQILPKTESSNVGCYYFKTREGKWAHTIEVKM